MIKIKKDTWINESGFIFAMIGSAVGFANILSSSAQCYKNGGGAFLIPFFMAIFIIGIPLLYLEGVIGKIYGLPMTSAYGLVRSKKWKVFGWIAALSCLGIGSFYSVITSWTVAYTYFAATSQIPADTATFFSQSFLMETNGVMNMGSFSFLIFFATTIVAAITWWVNSRDIGQGIEKMCYFHAFALCTDQYFRNRCMFLAWRVGWFLSVFAPGFQQAQRFYLVA